MFKLNKLNRLNFISEYQSSTVFDVDDNQDYQRGFSDKWRSSREVCLEEISSYFQKPSLEKAS